MNRLVKAQVGLEQSRKELGLLLDLEERGEDFNGKLEAAKAKVVSAQAEFSAAALVEPDDREQRSESTAEDREYAALEQRAKISDVVDSILNGRAITGATREYQEHHRLGGNEFHIRQLLPDLETRAVTPAPTNVGQNQAAIVPYVFPDSVASFLGVDMPTVGVGEAVYPVLTSELTVGTPAENIAQAETTGAFSADVLSPSRIQAAFFYSREDRARFAGMDSALRENLSMGLSDGLDKQIVAGTNGLLTGTNLANHAATAITTFANYVSEFGYGRIDGRYATMADDLRIVMGTGTYAHAGGVYRASEADQTALERLMQITGGVRVSAHVPDVAASKQNGIIRRGMRRDMVAPLWANVAIIDDQVTLADKGQIKLTAVMLHAVKILRADGFYKQQSQHA